MPGELAPTMRHLRHTLRLRPSLCHGSGGVRLGTTQAVSIEPLARIEGPSTEEGS